MAGKKWRENGGCGSLGAFEIVGRTNQGVLYMANQSKGTVWGGKKEDRWVQAGPKEATAKNEGEKLIIRAYQSTLRF